MLTTPQRSLLKLLKQTGNNIRKDRLIYRFHVYTRGGTYIQNANASTLEALIRMKYVTRVPYNGGLSYEYQISVAGIMALDENPATGPVDFRPKKRQHHGRD